jgi:hypothetical protein
MMRLLRWLFDRLWHRAAKHTWMQPFVLWLAKITHQQIPMTRYRTLAQLKRAAKKVKIPEHGGDQLKRWKELDRRLALLNDQELAEHFALNMALGNKGVLKR